MAKDLQTIYENINSELLTEDVKKAISDLITEKVAEKVQLELESALKTQDEDHTLKFEQAIAAIDEDHTAKVKAVVEHVNKDHTKKLIFLEKKYKEMLQETAVSHRDSLVTAVDTFLNEEVIGKRIPKVQILEAAKNNYTQKQLDEARKILGVDKSFIKENVKSALIDGKKQVDKLIKENVELRKHQTIDESKKTLFELTQNLPVDSARFVRSRLQGKPAKFIKDNFDYVMEMYERNEKSEKRSLLSEQKLHVDRNLVTDELVKESKNSTQNTPVSNNPLMDTYLSGMDFRK